MSNQSFWFLENIDLDGIFCPQKIENAINSDDDKTYQKGDYIYLQEEAADKIYFISEGRVKIGSYADSGKEFTKAILNTGEIFGELSFIGEKKRRDFAIAMEKTILCIVSKNEMTNLMKEHSTLNLFMMKVLGSRVLEMEQRLESLVFKDSRTRIIEFLISLVNKRGQRIGYEMLVRKFLTHEEIAKLTATSRQTVTTILNELRNENILTFNRRRLLIRDMEKLNDEIEDKK